MEKKHLLNYAVEIAFNAHKNQLDKNGEPYFLHLSRVMNMGKTTDEKICGVLHDLIEDTDWTFDKLLEAGFPENIVDAIRCLTKITNDENYDDFIQRVIPNKLAVCVKINDLTDNMDVRRFSIVQEKDFARINKYLKAYRILTEWRNRI